MKENKNTFTCPQCGKKHSRDVVELSYKRPDDVHAMPKEQREKDVKESDDLCRIRDERFFVRGVIPLAVEGRERPYRIGAWVELDKKTFKRVLELWSDPNQAAEPAFSAQLANNVRLLPPTLGLPVKLTPTGETTRPDILAPESPHPLHREQCLGITEHRAQEYSAGLT